MQKCAAKRFFCFVNKKSWKNVWKYLLWHGMHTKMKKLLSSKAKIKLSLHAFSQTFSDTVYAKHSNKEKKVWNRETFYESWKCSFAGKIFNFLTCFRKKVFSHLFGVKNRKVARMKQTFLSFVEASEDSLDLSFATTVERMRFSRRGYMFVEHIYMS